MLTACEKEMESLYKLLAEVETNEDSDFDNEYNGPEDVLKKNFSDHESFRKHDMESEEDGGSGIKKLITRNGFHQKMAYSGGKQNLGRIFVIDVLYCVMLTWN
ncbi:hypothetical protein AVEN_128603-1 [Araneus ventricosus]|uniref:Uncharacterized protein n=1 Tax=Araneus ventricosus TaxID=182803 RepID=A0A4Y2RC70_ARAVE|nr:hypothetical protein AVEN_128603-1 [Araneus ventricosus]